MSVSSLKVPEFRQFISGESVQASGPEMRLESRSGPEPLLGVIQGATATEVAQAYDAAIYAQPLWAASTPATRAGVLRRAAELFRERAQALGELISREMGKPLEQGVAEVAKGASVFDYYASSGYRSHGDSYQTDTGDDVVILREPLGVVALVTPWNFPFTLPVRKIGAAVGVGNSVILKPAPGGVAIALEIASTLREAGLPEGVCNVIYGRVEDIETALFTDPRLAAVSLTGSYQSAAAVRRVLPVHVPFQAELGGKNSLVIWSDADIDHAIRCIVSSAFVNNGQVCTSAGRLLLHEDIADDILDRLGAVLADMAQGQHGVLANSAADSRFRDAVEGAREDETDVVRAPWDENCAAPTLLIEPKDQKLLTEEIFGPVVTVERVTSIEDAVTKANATDYGLTAGIVTNNLAVAQRFWKGVDAGTVKVNVPLTGSPFHVPMQGFGHSGVGAGEGGTVSEEFFTRRKAVFVGMPR